MTDRLRRIVVGGTPSTWDSAVPMGAVLAAALFAAVFARGDVLDDMPVITPRTDVLIVLYAACVGMLMAAPLAMILLRLPALARPRRFGAWLLPGLLVILLAGFVGPLLLRAALHATLDFSTTWSEGTWTLPQVVAAAISGLPPGMDPGAAGAGAARLIARSAAPWALFLAAWVASWPLARARPVHVGWPLTMALAAMTLGVVIAKARLVPAAAPLTTRLALAALPGFVAPLVAWCVACWAARRWPVTEAPPVRPPSLRWALATVAAVMACLAAWMGYVGTRGVRASLREPPRVGTLAPDFTLVDVAGERVTLSQLRGRPVLIAFWASWCGPCRTEFPHLGLIAAADEVAVLAISRDRDRAAMDAYLATQELKPRVVVDDGSAALAYDVSGIPVTWLLDAEGRVLWRMLGFGQKGSGPLRDAVRAATK